ncbi:hypothetical protein LTR15_002069 [Elasticomyces elasticus]|nr:hypothetical protein LTR15_002069 [Elasticomyces elasticus]
MARNTPQLLVDSESIQLHAHRAVQARRRQIIPGMTDSPSSEIDTTLAPSDNVASGRGGTSSFDVDMHCGLSDESCRMIGLRNPTMITLKLKFQETMSELRTQIRNAVLTLSRTGVDVNKVFRGVTAIRFRTTIRVHGQPPFDLDDAEYGGRLPQYLDFFFNPATATEPVRATITLHVEFAEEVRAAKKQKVAAGAVRAIDLEKLVRAAGQNITSCSDMVRVGDVDGLTQKQANDVAQEYPLMAAPDALAKRNVQLWGTKAWVFDDKSIGGFKVKQESVRFIQKYLWYDGFKDVKNGSALRKRIVEGQQGDPRVPFLPPITFNKFDPAACRPSLGKAAITESRTVVVVVRYVSHLSESSRNGLQFHEDFQLIIDHRDDFDSLMKNIRAELWDNPGTATLFEDGLGDTWWLQLWILPQVSEPQKLFRLEQADVLSNFVSPEGLKKQPPKLYMEAHIWPSAVQDEVDVVQHRDTGDEEGEEDEASADDDDLEEPDLPQQTRSQRSTGTKRKASGKTKVNGRGGNGSDPRHERAKPEQATGGAVDEPAGQADEEVMPAGILEHSRLLAEEEEAERIERALQLSEEEHRAYVGLEGGRSMADTGLDGALTAEETADVADRHHSFHRADGGYHADEPEEAQSGRTSEHIAAAEAAGRDADDTEEREQDTTEHAGHSIDTDEQNGQSPSSAEVYRRRKLSIDDHVPKRLRI